MPEAAGPSDADRDRIASALGQHYAEGRIDADELSRRLDVVYGEVSAEAAAAVLGDLPPLGAPPQRGRHARGRHGEADRPQPGWLPTTERFRDPTTRRLMRVWVDPRDRARHYVAE